MIITAGWEIFLMLEASKHLTMLQLMSGWRKVGILLQELLEKINSKIVLGNDGSDFIPVQYVPKVGDPENKDGLVDSSFWRHYIYTYTSQSDDDYMESRCAKRCLLSKDDHCNFYFWGNDHCQLGRFNSAGNQFQGDINEATVYQLKLSIGKYLL